VNIWVLPELTEKLMHSGVQLQGDDTSKTSWKADWKKAVIFCCSINAHRWRSMRLSVVGCAHSSTRFLC